MASIRKTVAAALQKELVEGTVFRVDMDRVDVAPNGSTGILRSLPLTGDRDKVKPGDPVRVINVAGERVALVGDVAFSEALGEEAADASEIVMEENLARGRGTSEVVTGIYLDASGIANPVDGQALVWDETAGKWVNDDVAGAGSLPDVPLSGGSFVLRGTIQQDEEVVDWGPASDFAASVHVHNGLIGYTGNAPIGTAGAIGSEVQGTGGAASLAFHRPNQFAVNFGLDSDNHLKVGGWSMGANSYRIWHEGNDGAGSGLNADTLDDLHMVELNRIFKSAYEWYPAFGGALVFPSNYSHITREFRDNSTDIIDTAIPVPLGWQSRTLYVDLYYVCPGSTGNIYWTCEIRHFRPDVQISNTINMGGSAVAVGGGHWGRVATINCGTVNTYAGSSFSVRVYRHGQNAADTAAASAYLSAVKFRVG